MNFSLITELPSLCAALVGCYRRLFPNFSVSQRIGCKTSHRTPLPVAITFNWRLICSIIRRFRLNQTKYLRGQRGNLQDCQRTGGPIVIIFEVGCVVVRPHHESLDASRLSTSTDLFSALRKINQSTPPSWYVQLQRIRSIH